MLCDAGLFTQGLSETKAAMSACSTDQSAPLVIYVSKMIAVPASALPRVPGACILFPLHLSHWAFLPCSWQWSSRLMGQCEPDIMLQTYPVVWSAMQRSSRQAAPRTVNAPRVPAALGLKLGGCPAGEPGPKDPKQEVFLAFARIFSGVVTDGQRIHVLSAAYNPARPVLERQEVQVSMLLHPS